MSNSVIKYKSPVSSDRTVVHCTGFKLDSEPSCYICHVALSDKEKEHKSTFRYYDTDGNVIGTVETYVCFDCMAVLTEQGVSTMKMSKVLEKGKDNE